MASLSSFSRHLNSSLPSVLFLAGSTLFVPCQSQFFHRTEAWRTNQHGRAKQGGRQAAMPPTNHFVIFLNFMDKTASRQARSIQMPFAQER